MIILDTNIVSEVMRPQPASQVVQWLNGHSAVALYVTAITVAEIRFGLCAIPDGRRRQDLTRRFEQFIATGFAPGHVLGFGIEAAGHYGELMAGRREIGRPMSMADGQIAAIARAQGFAVATRNIKDFTNCGLELIDPFTT